MKIRQFDEKMVYDLTHIAKLFVTELIWVEALNGEGVELNIESENNEAAVSLFFDGKIMAQRICTTGKREIKAAAWSVLNEAFETQSQYGILVGVRPVKVVHQMMERGLAAAQMISELESLYCIHPQKAKLLVEVAAAERQHLVQDLDKISLYIGIPFCPSICTYCSFPSNDITKKPKLVVPYVDALLKEIDAAFDLAREHGREIDVVYIGGGTPTAIPVEELERIITRLETHLDLEALKEFTVEAGRPKTLTDKMIEMLSRHKVQRICLNPQTLNDEALKLIGRSHTGLDVIDAMERIEPWKFSSVNMDLIVGLPGDNRETFDETIRQVLEMRPENITVHTLALKKASEIRNNPERYALASAKQVEAALEHASSQLRQAGYRPYYLYRQKNILGNFENIGYALTGKESIYNIRIIEEKHPILALGVGGVSKRVHQDHETFDRIPNFRSVEDYLARFQEVIDRKRDFFVLP